MTNNLEKVEQALNELRNSLYTHDNSYQYVPNYYPSSEAGQTFEKNTKDLLSISYSLLYRVKEQQSEINKLKEDLSKKDLTDNTPVVIMVDNQYYLEEIANTVDIYGLLQDPTETGIYGYYPYSVAKKVIEATPVEGLLDNHGVEILTLDELKEKLGRSWNFCELGLYQ